MTEEEESEVEYARHGDSCCLPAKYRAFEAPSSNQSPNSAIYLPFDPSGEILKHSDFDADYVIYDGDSHLEAEIARQRLFSKSAQRGMAALLTHALGLVDVHTGVEPRSHQVPLYFQVDGNALLGNLVTRQTSISITSNGTMVLAD
jgi:hypothetical protein